MGKELFHGKDSIKIEEKGGNRTAALGGIITGHSYNKIT